MVLRQRSRPTSSETEGEPSRLARLHLPRERRYRRFRLRYPICLKLHSGGLVSEVDAVSKNVSIGGLLAVAPELIPQQSAVTFLIRLRGWTNRLIELAGEGVVVRVEGTGAGFEIAVKFNNPIVQIQRYLPGTSS
jgi:hypothetical protein